MSEIDHYDYPLPRELIAQQPLARRSDARMLVVDRGSDTFWHAHVRDLPEMLNPSDCLVVNDTRVVPARLVGRRTQTGGRWVGLFLAADESGIWRLLGKTRGKLQPGETITLQDRLGRNDVTMRMIAPLGGGQWAAQPEPDEPPWTLLERVGRVPLPPYIRGGEMEEGDMLAYQTIYAEHRGAVAAPTAGLHFTKELMEQIQQRGIETCRVTLHVGEGTFRPIAVEALEQHTMHTEWGRIDADTVERLRKTRAAGGRIVAVGTTSVRVLETAAAEGELQAWQGETNLFIRPPYEFRAVDAMLTNFHLPKSTLLVLVRTFGGDDLIRRAYEEAVSQGYRFFSYGDAMLIQ